jgi:hypothetical protein
MMPKTVKSILLADNIYRSVVRSMSWGSCGGNIAYTTLPVGLDGKISTQQFPEEDVVAEIYPRYSVEAKSLDVGAGNFLNLRFIHLVDPNVPCTDGWNPPKYGTIPSTAPITEGPPVYHCTFSSFCAYASGGFPHYTPDGMIDWEERRRERKEEIAEDLAGFHKALGEMGPCTLSFILREYKDSLPHCQIKQFKKLILDPMGWEDKVIYRSPLFNNRAHSHPEDCLQFIAIQLKGN